MGATLLGVLLVDTRAAVDFEKEVKPLLEAKCLSCHRQKSAKGKYAMHTKEAAFDGGSSGEAIVPGKPEESLFWELVNLPADDDDVMPPVDKGGPLPDAEKAIIKNWIAEGAKWPDGITLKLSQKLDFKRDVKPVLDKLSDDDKAILKKWIAQGAEWPPDTAGTDALTDNLELVKKMREEIVANTKLKDENEMKAYEATIPIGEGVKFEMVPIPSGTFIMGSPESEKKRKDDEGPQHSVTIAPFWMGKCEVSWDSYESYMISEDRRNKDGTKMFPSPDDEIAEIISRPTKPYQEMSFGMGKIGFPAICMTQHAANKYCQWLSALTGHFYRLPTEAEWEYACRAGTTTRWSFGDDEKELHKHAWFVDNSNFKYQKVGQKLPNPWGLHDMHGNVSEWVLDGYAPYNVEAKDNPWHRAEDLYPRVVRGGSWNDFPEALRSAVRRASDKTWKLQDPQLPKSIWYHTEPTFLGFRIVRPLEVPSAEEMEAYWNAANMDR